MKSPTRILIIEDNPDDEALLMRQLKKAQFEKHVKVIRDGGKALDFLTDKKSNSENLSAVFLDLNLPTMSGLDILEAIRANDQLQDLPVIIMTSSNSPENLERCQELGISSFVSKPLTLSSFAKAFADNFHARRLSETTHLSARVD